MAQPETPRKIRPLQDPTGATGPESSDMLARRSFGRRLPGPRTRGRRCGVSLSRLRCWPGSVCAGGDGQADDFGRWLAEFRAEAAGKGISPATLDAALTGLRPLEKVLNRDRKQPEFKLTFETYSNRLLKPVNIERGRAMMAEHAGLLRRVSGRYGVQPRFIVAIWGIETRYGAIKGSTEVVPALATLAFDRRRSRFFRAQLLDALRMVDRGYIGLADMKGSWAGAMGHPQFIPSSYLAFAQDFDGDGRRDIWNNLGDVFASIANYLHQHGWSDARTWGARGAGAEDSKAGLRFDGRREGEGMPRAPAGDKSAEPRAVAGGGPAPPVRRRVAGRHARRQTAYAGRRRRQRLPHLSQLRKPVALQLLEPLCADGRAAVGCRRRASMIRALSLLLAFAVCACSSPDTIKRTAKTGERGGKVVDRRLGVSASPYRPLTYNVSSYKVGEPYKIAERWYRPKEYETFSETGMASWYGHKFHSRQTANGEVFNMYAMTAAHRVLPMPSVVRVTNLSNGEAWSCASTTAVPMRVSGSSTCRSQRPRRSVFAARALPGCGSNCCPS